MRERSLFNSYNARFLDPVLVGKGFIYSSKFDEVVPNQHSLLIGPRGSGKTTFLKMLTIPALHNWRHPRKYDILNRVRYVAIYVPSDFTWYPEFRRPINAIQNKDVDDLLSYALFRSHLLLSVCDALEHLSNPVYGSDRFLRELIPRINAKRIDNLSVILLETWHLEASHASLFYLKKAVNERIRALQYLLTVSSTKQLDVAQLLSEYRFLPDNFFDDLRSFADAFSEVFAQSPKWTICFDEVEIAPQIVKMHILRSPRSFDQRFFVKCSASPFDEQFGSIFGSKMPMAAQDFSKVLLTQFSAICRDAGIKDKNALQILGTSFLEDSFDLDAEQQLDLYEPKNEEPEGAPTHRPYERGGFHFRKFVSLAQKDKTFAAYLQRRNVDLGSMDVLPEHLKAADVRKIISVVTVRDEFISEFSDDRRHKRLRSRKIVSEIYTGARAIFALCEGNPRWLIGLLRPLLDAYLEGRVVERSGIVQRAEQSRRIQLIITQYLSLLSTITPSHKCDSDHTEAGVLQTIDAIGNYLGDQVIRGPFNPDPVLSFKPDDAVSENLRAIIGAAMNQGAFVLLPSARDPSVLGTIDNQRVRITHLLAPLYRLPLVTGRAVLLSTIFPASAQKEKERPLLFELFGAVQ